MFRKLASSILLTARKLTISNRGNVAVIFALALIPLIVAVGGTVDYGKAFEARQHMQDAIDATSLALAREANIGSMTASQMKQSAMDFFKANFSDSLAEKIKVTASYSAAGPTVKVDGTAEVPADFLGLIGLDHFPISVSATTTWGQQLLRVSLVLDNTGSMAQSGKMDALKTATHNLLSQLKTAAGKDGNVYVSIIPFSKDVSVAGDKQYWKQSWVSWDLWDETNGKCNKGGYSDQSSCTSNGSCSKRRYRSEPVCTAHRGKWKLNKWTPANHKTWNGCITDRDQDYDTENTAPADATTATLFPAEQYSSCPSPLMGLTYDWTALDKAVDAMEPNGNTNQAIGLQWGWQSLTEAPFTVPAMDPALKYKQIIILLTDGLNTEDRWYTNQGQIDARQKIACDNIKATSALVYTVQVNTGHDPTSTLLQDCASNSSGFFLLTSADEIVATFQQIGTEISDLRVSL